ncbi:MAG: type II toxin-antitoxin system VapC family toxin [Tannerella sp.]|jgi:PIN domain nuclease of toxin-antitoxin system|nr:type II toxin-antitoxin system VapC family toxin [Tannerella sp.]
MNKSNAYYLDTNIIVYYLFDKSIDDNLDYRVLDLLGDPSNFFYASYVSVKELIHLQKQERIKLSGLQKNKTILNLLDEAGIITIPVTEKHLVVYETLNFIQEHNDPNDLLIIAQSISDKIPVISSDGKFKLYESQGLQLVFNKR